MQIQEVEFAWWDLNTLVDETGKEREATRIITLGEN